MLCLVVAVVVVVSIGNNDNLCIVIESIPLNTLRLKEKRTLSHERTFSIERSISIVCRQNRFTLIVRPTPTILPGLTSTMILCTTIRALITILITLVG